MTLKWEPVGRCPTTQIDWSDWLDKDQPLDPYLIWADISGFQGFDARAPGAQGHWPILLELDAANREVPSGVADSAACKATNCHPAMGLLDIPGAYKRLDQIGPDKQAFLNSKFITARVSPGNVQELLRHPDVFKRFQLGIPRIPALDVQAREQPLQAGGARPRVVVGVIDDGFALAHEQLLDTNGVPRTCWLWDQDRQPQAPWRDSVYNFGYGAELHHTEIQRAVQQAAGPKNGAALQALAAYAALDYVPHRPHADWQSDSLGDSALALCAPLDSLKAASHGTAVVALAAGTVQALPRWHAAQGQVPPREGFVDQDAAESWPLVLVQLPSRTTFDTSGGSLAVHVLDGIHYIIQRARTLPDVKAADANGRPRFSPPDALARDAQPLPQYRFNRIVINLSYSAVAGPHDGTSMLEMAIAELVSDPRQLLWVVVAAGNAHGARNHARLALEAGGDAKSFYWTVGPDNLLESYLEIWLPDVQMGRDGEATPLGNGLAEALLLEVQGPAGAPVLTLVPGKLLGKAWSLQRSAPGQTTKPVASVIAARRVVQGQRGHLVLLTVARTQPELQGSVGAGPPPKESTTQPPPPKAATAPHGIWRVKLKWDASVNVKRRAVVHAWAERSDQLWGQPRRQQSSVAAEDPLPEQTEHSPTVLKFCADSRPLRAYTDDVPKPFQPELSLGSAAHLGDRDELLGEQNGAFAVGAYRLADGEMAAYSGSGPTRSAPADRHLLAGGDCSTVAAGTMTPLDTAHQARNTGPVADAPSDAGNALRGLRTVGLRNGAQSRLGGTSAAAPLMVRFLANSLSRAPAANASVDNPPEDLPVAHLTKPASVPATEKARRPTPKPTADDRFRRGVWRLKVPGGPD